MGNQTCKVKNEINHPSFQNLRISEDQQRIEADFPVFNINDYQKWVKRLEKMKFHLHEGMFVPLKHSFKNQSLCGSAGIVTIQFDNFLLTLEDHIYERAKNNIYFAEEDLWYLLYILTLTSEKLKKITSRIGDVCPKNIFINNKSGAIKIGSILSWPGFKTGYQKKFAEQENSYLSPEQLEGIELRRDEADIGVYVAEAFSIGLTVLSTALLKDCSDIYGPKQFDFNQELLDKMMKELWTLNISQDKNKFETYSKSLKMLINAMCEVSLNSRITCQKVYNYIRPYQDSIVKYKDFEPSRFIIPNYEHLTGKPNKFYQENNRVKFLNGQQRQVIRSPQPVFRSPPPIHPQISTQMPPPQMPPPINQRIYKQKTQIIQKRQYMPPPQAFSFSKEYQQQQEQKPQFLQLQSKSIKQIPGFSAIFTSSSKNSKISVNSERHSQISKKSQKSRNDQSDKQNSLINSVVSSQGNILIRQETIHKQSDSLLLSKTISEEEKSVLEKIKEGKIELNSIKDEAMEKKIRELLENSKRIQ